MADGGRVGRTTAAGRAQKARTTALQPVTPKIAEAARPLPLTAVRLTGGPLKHAQELDAEYLLELEPDRMLAFYRTRAGLPKKAEPYGGWDGDGRNLTGHIAGHHLSAVSLMWAATGDARFKAARRLHRRELKEVQDKNGDGYLGALDGRREAFARGRQGEHPVGRLRSQRPVVAVVHAAQDLRRTARRLSLHRQPHGARRRDEVRRVGRKRPARSWTTRRCRRCSNTEFGGMNEVLADLYADTGDKRWLELSYRFEHRAVHRSAEAHEDDLDGLHGNTQIPKLIGSAARYVYTGDRATALGRDVLLGSRGRSTTRFATGGHGKDEYFGEPDRLERRSSTAAPPRRATSTTC